MVGPLTVGATLGEKLSESTPAASGATEWPPQVGTLFAPFPKDVANVARPTMPA
jgi:hypothetical protein